MKRPVVLIKKKRVSTGDRFEEEGFFARMDCEIGGFHPV